MRRWTFLPAVVLGLLCAAPAAPASAAALAPAPASAARACEGERGFSDKLACWSGQVAKAGPVPVVVTLNVPLQLDQGGVDQGLLDQAKKALDKGTLLVMLPGGKESGTGGTVLWVLAKQHYVAGNSRITRLDGETIKRLEGVGACQTGWCAKVSDQGQDGKKLTGAVPGSAFLDERSATNIGDFSFSSGGQSAGEGSGNTGQGQGQGQGNSGQGNASGGAAGQSGEKDTAGEESEGGGLPLTGIAIAAALVLLFAVIGLYLRNTLTPRTEQAGGPGPGPGGGRADPPVPLPYDPAPPQRQAPPHRSRRVAVPPGPRIPALVRTELHPQGYVEVDRCLYRAVWTDPDMPPPGLGEPVDVVKSTGQDADVLFAVRPGTGR